MESANEKLIPKGFDGIEAGVEAMLSGIFLNDCFARMKERRRSNFNLALATQALLNP